MKKDQLVVVTWIDTCCYHRWQEEDLPRTPLLCKTVGFLISKPKSKWVEVALTKDTEGGLYSEIMVIPKMNVKGIKKIR